jgi:hypothetical protein
MTFEPVLIVDPEDLKGQLVKANHRDQVAFVLESADPLRTAGLDRFLYVKSTPEFWEKVDLLDADPSILRELGY